MPLTGVINYVFCIYSIYAVARKKADLDSADARSYQPISNLSFLWIPVSEFREIAAWIAVGI